MQLAVVVPCFNVQAHILSVIESIPPEVGAIYLVDDGCPQKTGEFVRQNCKDARVQVLHNERNLGVGGAVVRGYEAALAGGSDIVIKIDGDGQMDTCYLPQLIEPLLRCQADYAKGNRMNRLPRRRVSARPMPPLRRVGNNVLSFAHKAASGYWNIVDPVNGFTAIHSAALQNLPLEELDRGYFFETDILFHLNLIDAVVRDVPMPAIYGEEKSNMRIARVMCEFPARLLKRLVKRIATKYFLLDFNIASLEILFGAPLFLGGAAWALYRWTYGVTHGEINSSGTVMLGALPIILGFQLLLSALAYDVQNLPKTPLCSYWKANEAGKVSGN